MATSQVPTASTFARMGRFPGRFIFSSSGSLDWCQINAVLKRLSGIVFFGVRVRTYVTTWIVGALVLALAVGPTIEAGDSSENFRVSPFLTAPSSLVVGLASAFTFPQKPTLLLKLTATVVFLAFGIGVLIRSERRRFAAFLLGHCLLLVVSAVPFSRHFHFIDDHSRP